MPIDPLFAARRLNDVGLKDADTIAEHFTTLLEKLKPFCPDNREFSICKTKLEEACFFAKKSMSTKTGVQK